MKINVNKLPLLLLVAASAALFSCSGKKQKTTTVTSTDGATVEIPADIYNYTTADRANKKKVAVEKLGFKSNVKDVKDHEFEGNQSLKELYLLNGFVHVSPYGFAGCTNLEKIVSTGTVDVLNDFSFQGCSSLKALDMNVRTVGLSTFQGCTSLEYFHSGDDLYWVRDSAFADCKNLKSVIMGIALNKFEDAAFAGCTEIEEISVPNDWKLHMFNVYKDMPKLQKVYLLTMEYYEFPANSIDFPCEQVDLYVPDSFLDKFKESTSWTRFKSILPLSQSAYFTEMGSRK